MKFKMKINNRSFRYNINKPICRPRHKYNKYKKALSKMILICIKQFMKKLSNTEAKLKKSFPYKKEFKSIETVEERVVAGTIPKFQCVCVCVCKINLK